MMIHDDPFQLMAEALNIFQSTDYPALEKMFIRFVLTRFDGDVALSADHLKIHRSTLYRKIAKHGLTVEKNKNSRRNIGA